MMNKTMNAKKRISLLVLGSVACLLGAIAMPLHQANAGSCSKSANSNANSNANGASTSVITDFSSASLVCGNRSTALSALGLDAATASASGKATICHIPPGNASAQHTITVSQSAVHAHMAHGDTMGACSGWVSEAYVESLPTCTAIDGGTMVTGVWMPDVAMGNGASLNAYFGQVQAGVYSGRPDSVSRSYREIAGN